MCVTPHEEFLRYDDLNSYVFYICSHDLLDVTSGRLKALPEKHVTNTERSGHSKHQLSARSQATRRHQIRMTNTCQEEDLVNISKPEKVNKYIKIITPFETTKTVAMKRN